MHVHDTHGLAAQRSLQVLTILRGQKRHWWCDGDPPRHVGMCVWQADGSQKRTGLEVILGIQAPLSPLSWQQRLLPAALLGLGRLLGMPSCV